MPFTVTIGTEGTISIGLLTAPLIGVLLGPISGVLAVLIGSLLGIMMNTASGVMGFFTPIATISGAFAAGMIRTGKGYGVIPVFIIGILAFLLSPIGTLAYGYIWLHLITLVLIVPLAIPSVSQFFERAFNLEIQTGMQIIAIAVVCFIAVMTDHIIGSSIAAYYFVIVYFMTPESLAPIFVAVSFVYPIERIVATAILTVVVLGVLRGIHTTSLVQQVEEPESAS